MVADHHISRAVRHDYVTALKLRCQYTWPNWHSCHTYTCLVTQCVSTHCLPCLRIRLATQCWMLAAQRRLIGISPLCFFFTWCTRGGPTQVHHTLLQTVTEPRHMHQSVLSPTLQCPADNSSHCGACTLPALIKQPVVEVLACQTVGLKVRDIDNGPRQLPVHMYC
jgi:hypothetical protein